MSKKWLLACVLGAGFTSLAYASTKEIATFKRTFTLDHVDIAINNDDPLENIVEDCPYAYEIRIENKGQPCYVRINIDEGEYQVNTEWVKIGEYYYYPETIDSNEEIVFSDEITFYDLQENDEFPIHIQSEAIQSDHFELDLSLDDPFKGVEIQSFETGGNV